MLQIHSVWRFFDLRSSIIPLNLPLSTGMPFDVTDVVVSYALNADSSGNRLSSTNPLSVVAPIFHVVDIDADRLPFLQKSAISYGDPSARTRSRPINGACSLLHVLQVDRLFSVRAITICHPLSKVEIAVDHLRTRAAGQTVIVVKALENAGASRAFARLKWLL